MKRKPTIREEELEFHRFVTKRVHDRIRREIERMESPEERAEYEGLLAATPQQRVAAFRRKYAPPPASSTGAS
jgi:hypothetical protein